VTAVKELLVSTNLINLSLGETPSAQADSSYPKSVSGMVCGGARRFRPSFYAH
jgi:hypothetical protein